MKRNFTFGGIMWIVSGQKIAVTCKESVKLMEFLTGKSVGPDYTQEAQYADALKSLVAQFPHLGTEATLEEVADLADSLDGVTEGSNAESNELAKWLVDQSTRLDIDVHAIIEVEGKGTQALSAANQ